MAPIAKTLALLGLAAVVAAGPAAPAGAAAGGRPTVTYALPGDPGCVEDDPVSCTFPEGVAFDPRTGYFYVSGAFDGTIFRGHLHRPTLEVFLPAGTDGRTSAIGIKVDGRGRLYVAGGGTGRVFVYDTRTRALVREFTASGAGFLNDLTFDRAGNAYVTDSLQPFLWRVRAADIRPTGTPGVAERFMDFTGTPVEYETGPFVFNLNGIVTGADGRALYTVHTNNGKLFRIDLASRTVAQVLVTGVDLHNGDGMLQLGNLLLVMVPERAVVATVRLGPGGLTGSGVAEYTDGTFRFPTTAAFARDRVLVVNSQFDALFGGQRPEWPFTVSAVSRSAVLDGPTHQ